MKLSNAILRALLVLIAVCIIQMIVGMLVPMTPIAVPHILQWMFLTNAVVVATLAAVAVRTEWRGWRLGTALAAIPLTIESVNLLEGAFFLTNSHLEWGKIFLHTLISAALTVPVWMLLFGRRDRAPEHYHPIQAKSRGERAWKLAVSDLTYLVLYFGAGMIIFPYVKDFYATQQLPSMGTIVGLQLLIRGPVFVLLCLALARMLGLPRLSGALAVGAVFTLLSGVAPYAESLLPRLRSLGPFRRGDQRKLRVRCNRRLALGTTQTGISASSPQSGVVGYDSPRSR
jgi:hypothetical protein